MKDLFPRILPISVPNFGLPLAPRALVRRAIGKPAQSRCPQAVNFHPLLATI